MVKPRKRDQPRTSSSASVDRAFAQFDSASRRLLDLLAPHGQLACRSGCSHCCKQQVSVTAPEVFRIAKHIRSKWSKQVAEQRLERARRVAVSVRGMSSVEHRGSPCPFLDDDRCSVYEMRPILCRGANSMDAAACETPSGGIPVYVELWETAQQLQEKLDREAQRTTGRTEMYELSCAVAVALGRPDAEERWRRGDPILQEARHSWVENGKLRHWKRSTS